MSLITAIRAARALSGDLGPDAPPEGQEYLRGQVELIGDMFGLDLNDWRTPLELMITGDVDL